MYHSGTQRNHFEYLVLFKAQYKYGFNPSLGGVGSKTSSRFIFQHNNCSEWFLYDRDLRHERVNEVV